MMLSKRGKATLIGVVAFGIALVIYLVLGRSEPPAPAGSQASEAASQGRDLRRKLGELLKPAPPAGAAPSGPPPTHSAGPECESCTTENCIAGTDDGCDSIPDPGDRKLCEAAYACFARSGCVHDGDSIQCWCGSNPTTCVTDNEGPTRANGPCVNEIFAAAKTTEADAIFRNYVSVDLPLGKATRLTLCRGHYCSPNCKIP